MVVFPEAYLMKIQKLTLTLGLLLTLSWSALAQSDTHVLYCLDQDVTGDGVAERIMVRSATSPDPNRPGSKDFVICENKGGKFVPVFRKALGDKVQFFPKVARFQWESPDTSLAGLKVRATDGPYPEIGVIFTPSSEDFRVFKYNGVNFEEIVFDGP